METRDTHLCLLTRMNTQALDELESAIDRRLGRVLRGWRRVRGLSRTDLSLLTGVPVWSIEEHERGELGLSLTRLVVFCHALNLRPVDVLAEAEAMMHGRPTAIDLPHCRGC